jgi:nitroreductase
VPDHGKLEPWRFIVLERAACQRLAALTAEIGREEGRDPDALAKDVAGFADAHLVVAVILSPKAFRKDPALGTGDVRRRRLPIARECLPRCGLGRGLADRVARPSRRASEPGPRARRHPKASRASSISGPKHGRRQNGPRPT